MSLKIPKVQTTERELNQLQQNVASALEPLFLHPRGSFMIQLTGCTTTVQAKATWETGVSPCAVTLAIPDLVGTSATGSTTATLTGLPAALWPKSPQSCMLRVRDAANGFVPGLAVIGTNGIITLYSTLSGSGWTGSSNKSVYASTITYVRGI